MLKTNRESILSFYIIPAMVLHNLHKEFLTFLACWKSKNDKANLFGEDLVVHNYEDIYFEDMKIIVKDKSHLPKSTLQALLKMKGNIWLAYICPEVTYEFQVVKNSVPQGIFFITFRVAVWNSRRRCTDLLANS